MTAAGAGSFDPVAYDAWFQTPVGRLTDQLEHQAVRALLLERPESPSTCRAAPATMPWTWPSADGR